jgi:hypothetical protein
MFVEEGLVDKKDNGAEDIPFLVFDIVLVCLIPDASIVDILNYMFVSEELRICWGGEGVVVFEKEVLGFHKLRVR